MTFSAGFLDEVRARASLVDGVRRRVRLTRKGREWLGLCPFHNEKTPSFTVNEEKGFYHCFGCGEHGSLFDFVMKTEGIGFRDAVERIAGEVGLQVPAETAEVRAQESKRQTLYETLEAATRYFQKMLRMPEGRHALAAFRARGLDDETIERFRLGYAPEGRSALRAELARENIPDEMMIDAGLLIQPEQQERAPYDRFRGRMIFPIADQRDRVVGFGGRIIGAGEPKYLNSPETSLFRKGDLLYGLSLAAAAARKAGTLIVAEGYMDVIALARAGYENSVAPLGTALTDNQIRTLWRYAPEPVLCFDGDGAGVRATRRAAERALPLLKPGYGMKFALIRTDRNDDPDTLTGSSYSPQFMQRTLSDAGSLSQFLFRAETYGRPMKTPEQRAAISRRLRELCSTIVDPDVRNAFNEAFYRGLRAQPGTRQTRDWRRPPAPSGVEQAQVPPAPPAAVHMAEKTLTAILINHPGLFDDVEEEIGSISFSTADLDDLRQHLVGMLSEDSATEPTVLKSKLEDCGCGGALRVALGDVLINRLRFVDPAAPPEDVRTAWRQNLLVVTQAASAAELASSQTEEDYSDAAIARRLGLKRSTIKDEDDRD